MPLEQISTTGLPGCCQVLGALDLAPENPEIWLEAAKAGCEVSFFTLEGLNILKLQNLGVTETAFRRYLEALDHQFEWVEISDLEAKRPRTCICKCGQGTCHTF